VVCGKNISIFTVSKMLLLTSQNLNRSHDCLLGGHFVIPRLILHMASRMHARTRARMHACMHTYTHTKSEIQLITVSCLSYHQHRIITVAQSTQIKIILTREISDPAVIRWTVSSSSSETAVPFRNFTDLK